MNFALADIIPPPRGAEFQGVEAVSLTVIGIMLVIMILAFMLQKPMEEK